MRQTYTNLIAACKDYTRDTSTEAVALFRRELNTAQQLIFAEMEGLSVQKKKNITSVANQQFYHYPADLQKIRAIAVIINDDLNYPHRTVLAPIDDEDEWNFLNATYIQSTALPTRFFSRRDDFGIWPTPRVSTYTIELSYEYKLRDLMFDDYVTGTVAVTNASAAVIGTGTTFTAAMVGRWFKVNNDGYEYRVSSYTDATHITLENVYEGSTGTGLAFVIGDSPEIPTEIHEILPYSVASLYFGGYRKDPAQAAYWNNMFWTGDPNNSSRDLRGAKGGLLGAKKRWQSMVEVRVYSRNAIHGATNNTKLQATQLSFS